MGHIWLLGQTFDMSAIHYICRPLAFCPSSSVKTVEPIPALRMQSKPLGQFETFPSVAPKSSKPGHSLEYIRETLRKSHNKKQRLFKQRQRLQFSEETLQPLEGAQSLNKAAVDL